MFRDPLSLVWRCAGFLEPVFTQDQLAAVPVDVKRLLSDRGILRQTNNATHVMCDACFGQHTEPVIRLEYADGKKRFYIMCPEAGRVEVPKERLLQWTIDFVPVLATIVRTLKITTEIEDIVHNRLWKLGRASLGGRSRVFWAARGLCLPMSQHFVDKLPHGKSPVLFALGSPPPDGAVSIASDSVIELAQVIKVEDGHLVFDREAVENQLVSTAIAPRKKPTKKRATRSTAIESLSEALKAHIISVRDRAFADIKNGVEPTLLPRPTQDFLAKQLHLSNSAVSRAIGDSRARELKLLWEIAATPEQILEYKKNYRD